MTLPATPGARAAAFADHLRPAVGIAGEETRWPMAERLSHYKCPGAAVAAIKDGRIDWSAGYGVRGVDDPRPVDGETVFMTASCSKPVCAMVLLQQVERGLVDLDVDVNVYLRRWRIPQNDFTAGETITLRHMLSHTAGLNLNGWPVVRRDAPLPTAIDILEGRPPSVHPAVVVNKRPGGGHRYSGAGFLLAEMLIEDVTGRRFDELADELIFAPLGMTGATFTHPLSAHLRANVACGHDRDGMPIPGGWMISVDKGAGGLMCSVTDFARFQIACRDAWLGRPGAILTQTLAREMMTRQGASTFGLGWDLIGEGDALRFNHGGSNDGYQCETDCYLASGLGGAAFTNAVSGIFLFREILNGLAGLYDWPGYLLKPKTVQRLSLEQLDRYTGSFDIITGIELPVMNVWREGDQLFSEIPGLRVGVRRMFIDENGVLFNQSGPFETHATFGSDGRVESLAVLSGGATEILRAQRRNP
jgi:CubicO group peptidase (beta-lactamase class C family)